MEITYHKENGYLIPNVVVGFDTTRPIGKYGRMRRKYLREHRPILFGLMVQNGTLFEHLIETEDAAQSRLEAIVPALAKAAGTTEALKAADQMKWGGIMNACKSQAEEVIFREIIFV
ncbi:MAG: TnpV protein [Clostridia bacterium]|nr:TnpV protein [Clostridia bacterium]